MVIENSYLSLSNYVPGMQLYAVTFNLIIDDNYIRKNLAKALVLSVAILDNCSMKRKLNKFNTIFNMVAT